MGVTTNKIRILIYLSISFYSLLIKPSKSSIPYIVNLLIKLTKKYKEVQEMRVKSLVSIFVIALMVFGLSLSLGTQDAQADEHKVTICHVQPTPANQDLTFAEGRVISINRDSCVDHCIDHGGDHVLADGACAFAFSGEKTCIVNSLNPTFCSVERCIILCETL